MSGEKQHCTHELMKDEAVTGTQLVTRTINAEVPESVYWRVRKCATESRLSMKEYLAKFCEEARVYPRDFQPITPATSESCDVSARIVPNQETR